MYSDPLETFVTTTSFGSWVPGDVRGYEAKGQFLPPIPELAAHVRRHMKQPLILFSLDEQDSIFEALRAASGLRLLAGELVTLSPGRAGGF
jgi:hypothetical protein